MNKETFLENLRQGLARLTPQEADEIVRDQDEYISDAIQSGRDEEEVLRSLGTPKEFAARVLAESKIQSMQQPAPLYKKLRRALSAFFATLALAPLNFIVLVGPFLLAMILILVGWLLSGIFIFLGVVLLPISLPMMLAGMWAMLAWLFACVGIVGLGILSFLAMYSATEFLISATASYVQWNVQLVNQVTKENV